LTFSTSSGDTQQVEYYLMEVDKGIWGIMLINGNSVYPIITLKVINARKALNF
jgi:hypothetical protein